MGKPRIKKMSAIYRYEAIQAFAELENWLEDRADADHPAGALGPLLNDEMRMLGELELIRKGFDAQSARIAELEAENARMKVVVDKAEHLIESAYAPFGLLDSTNEKGASDDG